VNTATTNSDSAFIRELGAQSQRSKAPWPPLQSLRAEALGFREGGFISLGDVERSFLRELLWNDASTEYDARFLTAWLRDKERKEGPFSASFWATHDLWASEEQRHFAGLFTVLVALFPECDWRDQLDRRSADFTHLESLLGDEFSILVTGAYDELVTVRAYRANLHVYGQVGPEFLRFVHLMIADEALHYARFLRCLQVEHKSRAPQAQSIVRSARLAAGRAPYGATFLLDHTDPEYTDELLASAERILVSNVMAAL
jgi:hypothetical protein